MEPRVGVVIPTVEGRDWWLARAIRSVPQASHVVVIRDRPACGWAWDEGIAMLLELHPDVVTHVLLYADDLEAWPEWDRAAPDGDEFAPAAMLYRPGGERDQADDGEPGAEVTFSRVPFLTRAQAARLRPFPKELHYYTDCLVYDWLGIRPRLDRRLAFTHYVAQPGRHHDDRADRALYERLRGERR